MPNENNFNWTNNFENNLLVLRDTEKKSYKQIAEMFGTTVSSVKHKYIRLKQLDNADQHHHPEQKIKQIVKYIKESNKKLSILETNAGMGNLTNVYRNFGDVLSFEIDSKKVKYLLSNKWDNVNLIKCDAFKEIHRLIYEGKKYDLIDLDPYGFPSRYFPHVFELIKDGILVMTFPKIGVQQINKIMIEHYKVFWNISLNDKVIYEEKIHSKMSEYAMQNFRSCHLIDSMDLGRMYRFVYKIKKESALELVDLKVKGVR